MSDHLDVRGRPARERLDRGDQAPIREHRRRDPAREVPQLPDRCGRLLPSLPHERRAIGVIGQPLLGAPKLHAERDQPGLGSVVEIALDPAQLGRLNVECSAARAGQLINPDLELPLTWPEEDRVECKRDGQGDEWEDRPEKAAARHRPDRQTGGDEHHRDARLHRVPASRSLRPKPSPTHGEPEAGRDRESERRPHGPEVAGSGRRPDDDQRGQEHEGRHERRPPRHRPKVDVVAVVSHFSIRSPRH